MDADYKELPDSRIEPDMGGEGKCGSDQHLCRTRVANTSRAIPKRVVLTVPLSHRATSQFAAFSDSCRKDGVLVDLVGQASAVAKDEDCVELIKDYWGDDAEAKITVQKAEPNDVYFLRPYDFKTADVTPTAACKSAVGMCNRL